MLTFNPHPISGQLPLIHVIDNDDWLLLNSPDAHWYRILFYFPWEDYRVLAVDYYNALYDFNLSRRNKPNAVEPDNETETEAVQRLLFERATVNKDAPVMALPDFKNAAAETVNINEIAPGITPQRSGGKKPKCFFALFKSHIGVSLMGFPPEPEMVHSFLSTNLSFARVCGFIPKSQDDQYWHRHVPAIRKLEQFDQIMTDYGLWNKNKYDEVRVNLENNVIAIENELVGDTTHYHAFSGFETVTYEDEKGKEKKKSQSKLTKNCRCLDPVNCQHPYILADDGAGTIVKAGNKYIWGHKASVPGFPAQGIPLDAAAVADAATFDGATLYPHVESLFTHFPEIEDNIDRILYDSACDDQKLKDRFMNDFGIVLKTSLNPRRRLTVTQGLPLGMARLTPYGNMICNAGIKMDYKGIRYSSEKFIYQAPCDENGVVVCKNCEHKQQCCPDAEKGRIVNLDFSQLPHIDQNDPPMAKRFKAIMTRRPSVERMIKRIKCDLSDDRLKKRSNRSFQAYLDKTMIAFHILLRS